MEKEDSNKNNLRFLDDLDTDVPKPTDKWKELSSSERMNMVKSVMTPEEMALFEVRQCNDNGYIYLNLLQPLPASIRGVTLLDFELKLKNILDDGITIWHTPQGDKSSLRRLRGVGVKS